MVDPDPSDPHGSTSDFFVNQIKLILVTQSYYPSGVYEYNYECSYGPALTNYNHNPHV